MSHFTQPAYNPKENCIRDAMWYDDYFGRHSYGVAFFGDEKVYTPLEVRIPKDIVFYPKGDARGG